MRGVHTAHEGDVPSGRSPCARGGPGHAEWIADHAPPNLPIARGQIGVQVVTLGPHGSARMGGA